jgi:hypothetical protein
MQKEEQMSRYSAADAKSVVTRLPAPSRELINNFQERWTQTHTESRQQKITDIEIHSIEYDSNAHRHITGYAGTIKQKGNPPLEFTVKAPTEINGNIKRLDITLKAPGAPVTTIQWAPVDGVDGNQAMTLLRDHAPLPLLVGPRAAFRLNEVDIPNNPLKISAEGHLLSKQIGDVKDLAQLANQEDKGIRLSYSPPESGKKGSLAHAARNAWAMVSGQWVELKGLRQEAAMLMKSDPGRFVLSAGFQDPGHMSAKDLKALLQPTEVATVDVSKKESLTIKDVVAAPFKFAYELGKGALRGAGVVIGAALDLPVIKQAWLGVRVATGAVGGVLTGDLFNRSTRIEFDPNGPAVITINGIWNNESAGELILEAGMKALGANKGTMIVNGTHWFGIGDLLQIAFYEYLGPVDRPVIATVQALKRGIQEKGNVFVIAHSQGTAVFKQALSILSAEEKSRIHYLGVGPEWIVDGRAEGLASSRNILNKGDFVPTLGNKLKVFSNLLFPSSWGRTSTIDVIRQDVGAQFGSAHHFNNYKKGVSIWGEEVLRKLNTEYVLTGH